MKNVRALLLFGLMAVSVSAQEATPPAQEWPLRIEGARAPIVLYQPQPETFKDDKLTARAAVSVQPEGKDPIFGAVWLEARIATDRDKRLVTVKDIKVPRTRFADAKPETEQILSKMIEDALSTKQFVISLDRFLVSLENAKKELQSAADLKTDPPKIYVEKSEAVLLLLDGEPQLRPIKDSEDQRIVNTPFDLILAKNKMYRLKAGERWLTASSLEGPWKDEANATAAVPKIIISKVPAELIVSKGEPTYTPLPGNALLYMSNTDSQVLVETATSKTFVLLSGRWYSASSLEGPWTFVKPNELPKAFSEIPPESPKGSVRVSVAGTTEATEAVMDAQIPQTSVVSHKDKDGKLQVTWDGTPQFKDISGMRVAYSVNASIPVFRVGNEGYWACHEGMWYAASDPQGRWVIANYVPNELHQIPPSCPYYNCKYVHTFEANGDAVYVGYYPGYVGSYPYYGTVYYGTGYYYSGWYGPHYYYPPPMMTWGFSFAYNPYSGWGVGVAWGMGGAGWVVVGGGGGPVYGGGWWGPGGYPGNRPRPTPYDRGNGQNIYDRGNRPSQLPAGQGDRGTRPSQQPAGQGERGARPSQQPAGQGDSGARPSQQPAGGGRVNNNMYADMQGNVSRQNPDGKWQSQSGGGWKDSAPSKDVQRDAQARDRGAQRTAQYQSSSNNNRSSSSGSTSRPSGGYSGGGSRGGGGGMRGGGGGRR